MDLRTTAIDIFTTAIRAADPYDGVKRALTLSDTALTIDGHVYPFANYPRIVVIGGGKASARMGEAAESVLGNRITSGWINTKDGHRVPLSHITVHECSHPVPDERGVTGTNRIIEILEDADEQTLVICLLSGGGSALLPAPAENITLADKQEITRLLLGAGADIGEINTIRKHLSRLKGGGMARLASPAALHVLILSDVIGDPLDTIASGPAVADPGTFQDCLDICGRYDILASLPIAVKKRFERGTAGDIPETAKSGDNCFSSAYNTLIGNNHISVEAAKQSAQAHGFNTYVLSTVLSGEAAELGTFFSAIASEIRHSGQPLEPPACIIGGGETTVTLHGTGKGGRNQEMALSAAFGIEGQPQTVFLSGGTDGTDGPTDAAGGIVDGATIERIRDAGVNPEALLADNDSYNCLETVDALLKTGPTGTNVMDIQILLVGEQD